MPVPQRVDFLVGWASCPPKKGLLKMVQDIRSIALSHQAPEKTVTKTEILAALKNLTSEERLEIIETASRMMREEIEEKAQRKAERKRKLRAAAEAAVKDYMPGGALHDLWSPDSEPYFDSEEEYLNAGIKTNA
jgi:hypothetical protein